MAIWTISAALGAGGLQVAEHVAARAGVSLFDRSALAALAHELEPEVEEFDDLEARVGGRLDALALSVAITSGSADAFRELQLRRTLPELGRKILGEAARRPSIILAPGAFAALRDHPAAVHVRLHAPLEWRIAAYCRDEVVDRRCAEKAIRRDDHQKRTWVQTLYHVDLDDAELFSLVVDVSRFPLDRLVEILLAAAATRSAV